jgi:hypothetical protein
MVKGKVILLACTEGMNGEWKYSSTSMKVKNKFKTLYRDWFRVADLIRNKHICIKVLLGKLLAYYAMRCVYATM